MSWVSGLYTVGLTSLYALPFLSFFGVVRNLFKVSCKIENDLLGVFIVCLGLVWNVYSKSSI